MPTAIRPRIKRLDPLAFAAEASSILRSAWRPPCLDYAPEYVSFQCSFPTTLEPIGLAIFEGHNPVGFIASTGRSSTTGELYLSSFLAFRPGSDPMLPIALVREENRTLQQTGRQVLIFTQVGSAGERMLKCRDSAGMKRIALGQYRIHAAVPNPATVNTRVQRISAEEWAVEANRLRDPTLLSPSFRSADLQHFTKDPLGRQFLVALAQDGKVLATGMLAFTSTIATTGLMRIPTLHYLRLADQQPAGVIALLAYAKDPSVPVVIVPNPIGISDGVAKSAGLRGTPSVFSAYLAFSTGEPPSFRGTEFEIV